MIRKYFLAVLFSVVAVLGFAKGSVTVVTEANASRPDDCVDVIVDLACAEDEVRAIECEFTLPKGLSPIGLPTYNEDRVDGFVPNLDVRDAGELSKITFLSLSGDYITETSGELFRFTVKVASGAGNVSFNLETTVVYDGSKSETVVSEVFIGGKSEFEVTAPESIEVDGEATVALSLANKAAIGGLSFKIELPEGLEIVTNKKGKADLTLSDRVSKTNSVSSKVAENTVTIAIVDAMSSELVKKGEGEVVSFKVKAVAEKPYGVIGITEIAVSEIDGKQTGCEDVFVIVNLNETAWNAIQNQIANVQEAVDNFDNIVASMMYASRYEGEEVTGPVDAARTWIAEATAAAQAKYEAGTLTQDDYVMGDMMAQMMAVNEALNAAAIYDAGRYVYAAVWTWYGNEDDEIEGAKDGVMEIVNQLPIPGQSAMNEQISYLEEAIAALLADYQTYTAYNEDNHNALVETSNLLISGIQDVVAAAEEALKDMHVVFKAVGETLSIGGDWGESNLAGIRDIRVEGLDDNSIVLYGFMGVAGYDVKIAFDESGETVGLSSIINGEETPAKDGWLQMYTGRKDIYYAQLAMEYCFGEYDEEEGYVVLQGYFTDADGNQDIDYYYIQWPQESTYTLAELKAMEIGEDDPGIACYVALDNAKVTLFNPEQGLGFMQDDEVGVIVAAFDEIEGLETGKSISGVVYAAWMDYGFGPMLLIVDASDIVATDAVATPKEISTFEDLADQDCRLVKITDSEATPIVVEDGTIYIGEDLMVSDLYDEPFEVPATVKSVTGIYALGAMLYIRDMNDIIDGTGTPVDINSVLMNSAVNSTIFNLAGQKVKSAKGIVVKDGKIMFGK